MARRKTLKKRIAGALVLVLVIALYLWRVMTGDTTTGYRYRYHMDAVKEKYQTFADLIDEEASFAIPGLARTNVTADKRVDEAGNVLAMQTKSKVSTHTMVPQGLCFAGNYILISAYDSKAKAPSVLYVLDRNTKAYLVTILLEDQNHVGGIAFDGTYVWIAKSGDCALSAISYERIAAAAEAGTDCVRVCYDATYDISCRASFVTYYDGILWVGVFEKADRGVSMLRGFRFHEEAHVNGMIQADELFLPEQANGAAITNIDGQVCLIVDTSYGRLRESRVHVYALSMDENNFETAVCVLKEEYVFPPMLEEVEFDGEAIYFVFESAATKYRSRITFRCQYPVDRVCVIPQDKLFSWTQETQELKETQETSVLAQTQEYTMQMQYHVSTAKESKTIPTYVKTTLHHGVQMLYNPYTARMLYSVVKDARNVSDKMVIGAASWNDTMSKNGYSNLQAFHHQDVVLDAERTRRVDVATGMVRQAAYNNQEKFNILIVIHTEASDAETGQNQTAAWKGIYRNATRLYKRLQSLEYEIPVVQSRKEGRAVITYQTMDFAHILKKMKHEDSRFTVTVTGEGVAGTIADVLAGVIFKQKGIYEGNVNCYTFGAAQVVQGAPYTGTNLFNLLLTTDAAQDEACPYGGSILYQPATEEETYADMLDAIEQRPEQYVRYNTDKPAKFYGMVTIDANCYAHFRELRVANTLEIPAQTCVFAGRKLYAYRLWVAGELEVHTLLYAKHTDIVNGNVSVDGKCMIGNVTNGIRGHLDITGADGCLEISGTRVIPYVSCTTHSLSHIKEYRKAYLESSSDEHTPFWEK